MAATRTPNGLVEKTQYDGAGRATVHFVSDGGGDSSWSDAMNVTGDWVLSQDEFHYDHASNLTGKVSRTRFDSQTALRTVKTTDPTNVFWTTGYDLAGNAISRTDSLGKTWTTNYDVFNRVTSTLDPVGNTTKQKYLVGGDKMVTYDGKNNTITTVLDSFGRTKQTLDQASKGATYTYDQANRKVEAIDARNDVAKYGYTKYEYDNLDRVRKVTEAVGTKDERTTQTNYDFRGDRFEVIDGKGTATKYAFDSAGRVEQEIRNANTLESLTTSYLYDNMDRVTLVTYPGERMMSREYDEQGRLKAEAQGAFFTFLPSTKYEYDAAGNLKKLTDPLNQSTKYDYDDAGRLERETNARGKETVTVYDKAGRRNTVTDSDSNFKSFEYDDAGRLWIETDSFSKAKVYRYDENNNVREIEYRDGKKITYVHDSRNRLREEIWARSTFSNSETQKHVFDYNDNGSLTKAETFKYDFDKNGKFIQLVDTNQTYTFEHDALNRVKHVEAPGGVVFDYTYDTNGNRLTVTDNKGGFEKTDYDNFNRVDFRTTKQNGNLVSTVDWEYNFLTGDKSGMTRFAVGGEAVTDTYIYDEFGRRKSSVTSTSKSTLSLETGYNAGNQVTFDSRDGITRTFGYDATNQLTNDNGIVHGYTDNGTRNTGGFVPGDGNRLEYDGVWNYTYDDEGRRTGKTNGSETWTYSYDNRGQMVSAIKGDGSGVGYEYDAFGNRIASMPIVGNEKVLSQRERYVVDGWDSAKPWAMGTENFDAVMDLDAAGNVLARRDFGPGFDDLLGVYVGEDVHWYATDRQGSVRGVFDNSGTLSSPIDYDAFGNKISSPPLSTEYSDQYGYTGREWDAATGLYHYRARMYDPKTGSFTSEDSVESDTNPYRYVNNAPTLGTDPSGMWLYADQEGAVNMLLNEFGVIGGRLVAAGVKPETYNFNLTRSPDGRIVFPDGDKSAAEWVRLALKNVRNGKIQVSSDMKRILEAALGWSDEIDIGERDGKLVQRIRTIPYKHVPGDIFRGSDTQWNNLTDRERYYYRGMAGEPVDPFEFARSVPRPVPTDRIFGGLQAVGGAGESAVGVVLLPATYGASSVLVIHGADNFDAGITAAGTGTPTATLTRQYFGAPVDDGLNHIGMIAGLPQIVRAPANAPRSVLDRAPEAGRIDRGLKVGIDNLSEQEAASILLELQTRARAAGVNSHFYGRHGAHTTLEQQANRAMTGIYPDAIPGAPPGLPVDSTMFLSHNDQLASLLRAYQLRPSLPVQIFEVCEVVAVSGLRFKRG